MKITNEQLKQIIKEELAFVLQEIDPTALATGPVNNAEKFLKSLGEKGVQTMEQFKMARQLSLPLLDKIFDELNIVDIPGKPDGAPLIQRLRKKLMNNPRTDTERLIALSRDGIRELIISIMGKERAKDEYFRDFMPSYNAIQQLFKAAALSPYGRDMMPPGVSF